MVRPARVLVSALAALALLAAACSEEAPPPSAAGPQAVQGSFPVTIDAANGAVQIVEQPQRVVSLSATATEMLFAIDAGEQVVAVDDTSNYPPEAPTTDLSAYEPNVEALAEYEPDLVVISDDIGDLLASLEALDIPAIHQPAAVSIDDTYDQIGELGEATGHVAEAEEVSEGIRADLQATAGSVPEFEDPPTYYHELDPTFFTATSQTFIGQIYALLGLENIADPADKDGSGYPQLSAEYIVEADPDLIFLSDTKCCGETPETVSERPGWAQIAAVQNGSVIELDDDVASRWGPRVVEFLDVVAAAVRDLEAS